MRLIDADDLKETIFEKTNSLEDLWDTAGVLNAINNAPTVTPKKPTVFFPSGETIILTDGHIKALCDYERDQMAKETIERYMKGLGI